LLRGVSIERANYVCSTDITYLPMHGGFLYLVAVMDWFSRFVIGWELSNTMETGFCLTALEAAFRFGQPENLELGSRLAAHSGGVLNAPKGPRHPNQYGRPRSRSGQRFYRAPVAQLGIRADLPRRLRQMAPTCFRRWTATSISTTTSARTRRSATARRPIGFRADDSEKGRRHDGGFCPYDAINLERHGENGP
jgi:hypothetical protein